MNPTVRLRYVAEINPATPEFDQVRDDASVTFLPLEAVWPGSSLDTSRVRLKAEVASGYTRFRSGDILIPKITPTFQANRTVLATGLLGGVGAGTTELHVVRPGPRVDPRYLLYTLASEPFLQEGEASMTGVAGQKRVPDDLVRDLPVLLRSTAEQRSIADYLDAETARIDSIVARRRLQMEALEARKWSALVDLVTGNPVGRHERPGQMSFPDAWSPTRIRYLVQPVQSGDWGDDPLGEDDVLVVRAADFDRARLRVDAARLPLRHVDPASVRQRTLLPGDLVLEKSGGGPEQPVGAAVLFDLDVLAIPSNFAARLRAADGVDPQFLCFLLAATYELGLNQRSIKQTTGIQNLDVGAFMSEGWSIPPVADQVRIGAEIRKDFGEVDALQRAIGRQIDLLVEHRQALITAAVTGQIEIPGAAA